LMIPPKGMTISQFKAYGVAVSKVVQSPSAMVFLLGMAGATADAVPPTNADGTANQAAQDAFVNAVVSAGLNDGIIALPPETTPAQLEQFARDLTAGMAANSGVTISPGAFLRALDGYIVAATLSNGTVNWQQVGTSISNLLGALAAAGLMKLPANITISNIQQFALGTAAGIQQYKQATGRANL